MNIKIFSAFCPGPRNARWGMVAGPALFQNCISRSMAMERREVGWKDLRRTPNLV